MGGGQSTTSVRKAKFSYVPHSDGLPLFGHSAVVTRGKMLIYGGHNGQSLFNKLFSIDLNNFEIKLLSNVVESSEEELTPVMGHSAIITTDNRMFVFGGFTAPLPLSKFTSKNDPMDDGLHNFEKWAGVKPVTNALYMFHIDSNCWQKVKVKSLPQNNHMVVRQPTPGGDIFSEAFSTIDNVHIHFETQLMSVPMPRALHAAAFSCHRNEQKMFVVGGLTHLEESSTSEAIYEMNLETYTWRRISFIPESDNPAKMDLRLPLFGHSCVVDSNRLIVIGGRHSLKLFHLVQVLDLDTFQWSFIDLEPSASSLISSFSDRNQPKLFPYFHSAVFDGDRKSVV